MFKPTPAGAHVTEPQPLVHGNYLSTQPSLSAQQTTASNLKVYTWVIKYVVDICIVWKRRMKGGTN